MTTNTTSEKSPFSKKFFSIILWGILMYVVFYFSTQRFISWHSREHEIFYRPLVILILTGFPFMLWIAKSIKDKVKNNEVEQKQ